MLTVPLKFISYLVISDPRDEWCHWWCQMSLLTSGIIKLHSFQLCSWYVIVPDRTHAYHHTALSEISNKIVGKILLRTISYHTLFVFRCGIYKYCSCSVYGTVWSGDEVWSTNCARRTMVVCFYCILKCTMATNFYIFLSWNCLFDLLVADVEPKLKPNNECFHQVSLCLLPFAQQTVHAEKLLHLHGNCQILQLFNSMQISWADANLKKKILCLH